MRWIASSPPASCNDGEGARARRLHHGKQAAWHAIYGAASNLPQRAWQHREGVVGGFTKRYGYKLLVWYERGETMDAVFTREHQIKVGSRAKKIQLIEAFNPDWRDLYDDVAGG